ncbi:uncharacterized protein C8Q71DRAFT_774731 [Rhodofomes roseus]|uniref:Uncharacterized protein n=1 Tax=Rhodofomes roseus TaxID=34475 RepID=A0ABQ8K7M6_9APHY|nr:uncharacterized protein C8Q71DRAFT_774731 [Rhodofomes roseus]KAH9833233.1 hypothetical protein C8Q71DRAFT_774731 [Rhodofomes roseus]
MQGRGTPVSGTGRSPPKKTHSKRTEMSAEGVSRTALMCRSQVGHQFTSIASTSAGADVASVVGEGQGRAASPCQASERVLGYRLDEWKACVWAPSRCRRASCDDVSRVEGRRGNDELAAVCGRAEHSGEQGGSVQRRGRGATSTTGTSCQWETRTKR